MDLSYHRFIAFGSAAPFVTVLAMFAVGGVFVPSTQAAETPSKSAASNGPARELIPRGDLSLYRLGPGDEIKVFQENAPELDGKTARIDDLGFINLPLTGRVKLSGLTLEESEQAVAGPLGKFLLTPNPVVSITDYRSQPVSVLGAVNTPGVLQLQGHKTLLELLSMAGGVVPTRGRKSKSPVGFPLARFLWRMQSRTRAATSAPARSTS